LPRGLAHHRANRAFVRPIRRKDGFADGFPQVAFFSRPGGMVVLRGSAAAEERAGWREGYASPATWPTSPYTSTSH